MVSRRHAEQPRSDFRPGAAARFLQKATGRQSAWRGRASGPVGGGNHAEECQERARTIILRLGVTTMDHAIESYCPSCFAMPGERCRSKYLILKDDEVLPVVCPTHRARLVV